MANLITGSSWLDWTNWARKEIVAPIARLIAPVRTGIAELESAVTGVANAVFDPITRHLNNLRFFGVAALLNSPRSIIRGKIKNAFQLESLKFYRVVESIRDSNATAITTILDDYVARIDSIELAVSSLLGRRLPIVEAISKDIHTLLGKGKEDDFPAAILALFDGVSDAFEGLLGELDIIARTNKDRNSSLSLDLGPGHFYEWVTCNTTVDKEAIRSDEERKQQQRLRHTMFKVVLTYIEEVDVSPSHFRSGGSGTTDSGSPGGFPLSSTSAKSVARSADGFMRAYAGLFAAAFEHIFVSSRPLASAGSGAPTGVADLYHDLPFTLKLQRPDLSKLAFAKPGYSAVAGNDIALELDSEFLAMKLATSSASVSAGLVRTAVNCVANGVWEISPNNPPLINTLASLISIPVYEIEKAIVYDVFRRFRIYVTDSKIDTSREFVVMHASMQVPDFSGHDRTEKELSAVIALTGADGELLNGLKTLLPDIPINLNEPHDIGSQSLAGMLHGTMKDALAVCYVASS